MRPRARATSRAGKEGDYARAEALGVRVVLMLVETFGGLGLALVLGHRWHCAPSRDNTPTLFESEKFESEKFEFDKFARNSGPVFLSSM